ncbi:hypothetical protein [Bradyrhizobium murdochi]|uniref:hypothetical protein n=1 Tax=Bradyrhizobium murdochi TaxID=1038859 RepID=UPI0004900ED0|nr:hypothetical protein [Bradyrhizobium murdochi]
MDNAVRANPQRAQIVRALGELPDHLGVTAIENRGRGCREQSRQFGVVKSVEKSAEAQNLFADAGRIALINIDISLLCTAKRNPCFTSPTVFGVGKYNRAVKPISICETA